MVVAARRNLTTEVEVVPILPEPTREGDRAKREIVAALKRAVNSKDGPFLSN
jgi:hypothetical protein